MPGFVKTAADERKWRECKASVSEASGKKPTDKGFPWANVTICFKNKKGGAGKKRASWGESGALK